VVNRVKFSLTLLSDRGYIWPVDGSMVPVVVVLGTAVVLLIIGVVDNKPDVVENELDPVIMLDKEDNDELEIVVDAVSVVAVSGEAEVSVE